MASAQEGTGVPSPGGFRGRVGGSQAWMADCAPRLQVVQLVVIKSAGEASGGATSAVRGGAHQDAGMGVLLPTLRQESGQSCLSGLVMGGGTRESILSPQLETGRGHTAWPRVVNSGGWGKGQEDEAPSRSERGTCSWRGLAWPGSKTREGGEQQWAPRPHLMRTWSVVTT